MKTESDLLIYSFENQSMPVGLAAFNATEPSFKAKFRYFWFNCSCITNYGSISIGDKKAPSIKPLE